MKTEKTDWIVVAIAIWVVIWILSVGYVALAQERHIPYTTLPTLPALPTFKAPAVNNWDATMRSIVNRYQAPQRQPRIDINSFLRDLQAPQWRQQEIQRGNRIMQRNAITIPACHKYSRACLNRLLSLE